MYTGIPYSVRNICFRASPSKVPEKYRHLLAPGRAAINEFEMDADAFPYLRFIAPHAKEPQPPHFPEEFVTWCEEHHAEVVEDVHDLLRKVFSPERLRAVLETESSVWGLICEDRP